MANITIKYKGLTGLHNSLTIDNGQTFTQLRTAIISDETLTASYYGPVSITKGSTLYDSTTNASVTLATAGVIAGDIVFTSSVEQSTKQVNQEMMVDTAALKRAAGGDTSKPYYRARSTYDVTKLPSRYVNDTVTDNAAALATGRPWS